jgi:hypothetical protein
VWLTFPSSAAALRCFSCARTRTSQPRPKRTLGGAEVHKVFFYESYFVAANVDGRCQVTSRRAPRCSELSCVRVPNNSSPAPCCSRGFDSLFVLQARITAPKFSCTHVTPSLCACTPRTQLVTPFQLLRWPRLSRARQVFAPGLPFHFACSRLYIRPPCARHSLLFLMQCLRLCGLQRIWPSLPLARARLCCAKEAPR